MCLGPRVEPPTQKAKTYVLILRALMVAQVIIVLLNFIAYPKFLQMAIFGIFFFFLLYIIQHQLVHQAIMVYIFISIFFAIEFMVYFLTPLQNHKNFNQYSAMEIYYYVDSIISFIYYAFAAVFCFYPYREFKAIQYSNNPSLRNYFNQEGETAPGTGENLAAPTTRTVNYDVNYGNIPYDQNKRNNDNGTFEVFKGKGVKIG